MFKKENFKVTLKVLFVRLIALSYVASYGMESVLNLDMTQVCFIFNIA